MPWCCGSAYAMHLWTWWIWCVCLLYMMMNDYYIPLDTWLSEVTVRLWTKFPCFLWNEILNIVSHCVSVEHPYLVDLVVFWTVSVIIVTYFCLLRLLLVVIFGIVEIQYYYLEPMNCIDLVYLASFDENVADICINTWFCFNICFVIIRGHKCW